MRNPDRLLAEQIASSRALAPQLLGWFMPALMVRPAAVLLRSLVIEAPTTAAVLAASSLILQIGTWVAFSLALPVLGRQFDVHLRERESLLLTGFASLPLWVAGALFVVPETIPLAFLWSRTLVLLLALLGAHIAYRGLGVVGARAEARLPLAAAMTATYGAVYLVLFVLLGVSSHALLYLLTALR